MLPYKTYYLFFQTLISHPLNVLLNEYKITKKRCHTQVIDYDLQDDIALELANLMYLRI